jgi:hypothetical protein
VSTFVSGDLVSWCTWALFMAELVQAALKAAGALGIAEYAETLAADGYVVVPPEVRTAALSLAWSAAGPLLRRAPAAALRRSRA